MLGEQAAGGGFESVESGNVEEGYEVTFRIGPLTASSLTARPLAPYRLVACTAPSYLTDRGVPQIPDDLKNHECLGYAYWSRPADREWVFCKGSAVERVQVVSRLQVNESKALLSAALDGFGIVLGPEDFLEPALRSGELVRLLADLRSTKPTNAFALHGQSSENSQTPTIYRGCARPLWCSLSRLLSCLSRIEL